MKVLETHLILIIILEFNTGTLHLTVDETTAQKNQFAKILELLWW